VGIDSMDGINSLSQERSGVMFGWFKSRFKKSNSKPKKVDTSKPKPIIIDGKVLDIEIHDLKGFNSNETEFFRRSCELLIDVLQSEEFNDRFLAMDPRETNGMSQKQVYDLILSGKDKHQDDADNDLDVIWELYGSSTKKSKTVGYTYGSTRRVWTHRWHLKKFMESDYPEARFCAHIGHETMHNFGFKHRYIKKKSLVYRTGYLIRELAIESMKGRKLTPVV
jgi:hypothetical protein